MLSQEDFLNLDHIRVLLRPSKTTITTQNLSQVDCNLGNLSYGRFLKPLGSRFEYFMFAGHEAVTCTEMCAISE